MHNVPGQPCLVRGHDPDRAPASRLLLTLIRRSGHVLHLPVMAASRKRKLSDERSEQAPTPDMHLLVMLEDAFVRVQHLHCHPGPCARDPSGNRFRATA